MQEALLAQDVLVICGDRYVELTIFLVVLSNLLRIGMLGEISAEPYAVHQAFGLTGPCRAWLHMQLIYALGRASDGTGIPPNLESAIMWSSICEATDPRDYIYGVYAIVNDAMVPELTPNYNMPVEEVYIRTTKYLMQKNNSLNLLCDAGIWSSSRLNIPSWVPSFNGMSSINCFVAYRGCLDMNITFPPCAPKHVTSDIFTSTTRGLQARRPMVHSSNSASLLHELQHTRQHLHS